jgi:dTDP-4-amino-4,6-dideoxygalactose transaminase
MIPVTKPFLPPKEEYVELVNNIWARNWLTNDGPLVNELELKLKNYLGLEHLLYMSNGTITLQIAIKALDLKGEIVTTPFSYVATTSSIVWEGCEPVFVDIDSDTFNIDPTKIEAAITENTSAILATHVYGNPCDIDAITRIAEKYDLKVIYDAAHCFGTTYKGRSVFEYGDISTISFHATKLFHTTEGGAVVTTQPELLKKMAFHRNFGHDGPVNYGGVGINGKNSEFHAAMGVCNLNYVDKILQKRASDHQRYNYWLDKLNLKKPLVAEEVKFNHAYYPVVFETQEQCELVLEELKKHEIYARRYFYPVLSKVGYVKEVSVPIAESISKRVLCLPLYYQLSEAEIDLVCRIILRTINYA